MRHLVHRLSYQSLVGAIPVGKEIDHLCRNTRCVNPRHMEPVTTRVNTLRGFGVTAILARQTHCKNGHPLSGDNIFRDALHRERGLRVCKVCKRNRQNVERRNKRRRKQ